MESKEDVQSDGSFELVNFDDYDDDMVHLNTRTDVSSDMDLSDGSYEFLSSEMSDTPVVLTKGEASNGTTVYEEKLCEDIKAVAFESPDPMEEDKEDEEEKEFLGMDVPDSVEKVTPIVKKGKVRNFMTMAYPNPNFDVFDSSFPANFKLKEDIKEVAKNHILRYLPAKALARSRLVSKEWNQWISSPFFAHMQSQYFRKISGFFEDKEGGAIRFISLDKSAYGVPYPSLLFLPRDVYIRSSCNGLLLCRAIDEETEYFVCNPANRGWIKLPYSSYYHGREPKYVLVYEPSYLNFEPCYQVVCPFSLPDIVKGPIVYFDIYDSKTQSWRISDMICVDLDESNIKSGGVFVNGVVYWETMGGEMLAFDLTNEIYGVQALPIGEGGALSKVHGELSYVKAWYHHPTKTCVLDVYGGSIMSRKNTITFDISSYELEDGELVDCAVLANTCDDVIAVTMKKFGGRNCLYVYHVKDQKVEGPKYLRDSNVSKLFPYVNNLVSLAP
ncbi:hypothetical protein OSB04_027462 [Centaurea solstitialis]|uniref:F-box protein n=1 Tax=Centaurea solstitialis TaxID=347529 RepID=A0AA38SQX1_9ASTR|nr:hypothetical protein OSB04_027462 [Centaurea solstitialis]